MSQTCFWKQIFADYDQTIFHIACIFNKHKKFARLIFGLLEFYPAVCESDMLATPWQSFNTPDDRIFYARRLIDARQGAAFYQHALCNEHTIFPDGSGKNTIVHGQLLQSTDIDRPYLATHEDLPFLPFDRGGFRILSAFNSNPDFVNDMVGREKVGEWLQERLGFAIVEMPQFDGSLHCCFRNPVYSELGCRLMPDGSNAVQFSFQPLPGNTVSGLTLCLMEEYEYGHAVNHPIQVSGEQMRCELAGQADKVQYLVWDSARGLIDFSPYCGFLRQMNVSFEIIDGRRRFKYIRGRETITAETDLIQNAGAFTLGESEPDTPPADPGKYIRNERIALARRRKSEKQGQFIFNNPEEARAVMIDLMHRAHKRLIIIDPYFDDAALVQYIASFGKLDIKPQIYTSGEGMKQKVEEGKETIKAEYLINLLDAHPDDLNCDVYVMPGKSRFHDRFLIVDDTVYLSGNSLNSLGDRLSALVRLDNGSEIDDILKEDQRGLPDIHAWFENHERESAGSRNGKNSNPA